MGLDMYLKVNSKAVCKDALRAMDETEKWKEWYLCRGIAMYWRKANAIHKWFVDNVQYGEDDCKIYEVLPSKLVELRDTCKEVIENSKLVDGQVVSGYKFVDDELVPQYADGKVIEDASKANELLPTQDGFFFGATEYNEWYLADLEYTANAIQLMLEHTVGDGWEVTHESDPDWDVQFYYHSSW